MKDTVGNLENEINVSLDLPSQRRRKWNFDGAVIGGTAIVLKDDFDGKGKLHICVYVCETEREREKAKVSRANDNRRLK